MATEWLQPADSVLSVERSILVDAGPTETENDRVASGFVQKTLTNRPEASAASAYGSNK